MDRKRLLVSSAVLIVLAVLVYLQFRTWKNFDWARFFEYRPEWHHIVHGIILI
jgi:predicted membrane chloride channel (bestrophin family)